MKCLERKEEDDLISALCEAVSMSFAKGVMVDLGHFLVQPSPCWGRNLLSSDPYDLLLTNLDRPAA